MRGVQSAGSLIHHREVVSTNTRSRLDQDIYYNRERTWRILSHPLYDRPLHGLSFFSGRPVLVRSNTWREYLDFQILILDSLVSGNKPSLGTNDLGQLYYIPIIYEGIAYILTLACIMPAQGCAYCLYINHSMYNACPRLCILLIY